MLTIGLISDTHGLLRPEALAALAGVDHIVHAGDIGAAAVLAGLEALAPVSAVRGNNDTDGWAQRLPESELLELAGRRLLVVHDVKTLGLDPAAAQIAAVIAGHSHRPAITERAGVLYVNPGSAGPRRFSLPVAVGFLELDGAGLRARIQPLL
jgi:uncharacterized protein